MEFYAYQKRVITVKMASVTRGASHQDIMKRMVTLLLLPLLLRFAPSQRDGELQD